MTRRTSSVEGRHVRTNRRAWERQAESYERRAGAFLSGRRAMAWGLWRLPEAELQLLGPVRARDLLEIGCGAARWLVALRARGARPVGLDVSHRRLEQAREEMRRSRRVFPLVEGNAERLPFADEAFDIVFCDWGAMTFSDPIRTIPEASRVLRPGGRLVFATLSPWRVVCTDPRRDRLKRSLQRSYFDLHRVAYADEVNFVLPYGEWIRRFREAGLLVERLLEPPSPSTRANPYLTRYEREWGRRWPLENIWLTRKVETVHLPRRRPPPRPAVTRTGDRR